MKRVAIIGAIFISVGLLAVTGTADTLPAGDLTTYYTAVINKKIDDCKAKTAYGESKLKSMQQTATQSTIKAKFLEANQDELLAEMAEAGLDAKAAKVEHFINQRFQEHLEMLNAHYLTFLERKIADCKAKVGYGQSKLDSMRRKAALSALKAQFLETNRDDLLAAMLETDVGTRAVKLERFINLRFTNFVHPRLMAYLTAP